MREHIYNGPNITGAISPSNSGTSLQKITFQAYGGTPLMQSNGDANRHYGLLLNGRNYVVVDGIVFELFDHMGGVSDGSYNEVKNCIFRNCASGFYIRANINLTEPQGSDHNWVHDNVFDTIDNPNTFACTEGGDILQVGLSVHDEGLSTNNTFEENTFKHAGHTLTESYDLYDVWRDNTYVNNGYKISDVTYGTTTNGSATTLVDSTKNFSDIGIIPGHYIFSASEYTKRGVVESVSTTINTNDTINFVRDSNAYGTPTFGVGIRYALSSCARVPSGDDTVQNGKYSHRCVSFTNTSGATISRKYVLFEGNRIGYAGSNPVNNGADSLTLGSPGNIIRHNEMFGGDGAGIVLKGYAGSVNNCGKDNAIYNNTVAKNGQAIYGNSNPIVRAAVHAYSSIAGSNRFKNNIFYQNGPSPYLLIVGSDPGQEWETNLCDLENSLYGCLAIVPDFLDLDISNPELIASVPNLELQENSEAIDGGTNLTQTNGSGSNSIILLVDDALYFQDGSWGSELTREAGVMQADQIAVGNIMNTVQISSIDYFTNTITLASPISWTDNDPVWLYKKSDGEVVLSGLAPDYGACEYVNPLQADFDSDGDVDIFDYNILLANFGTMGDCGNQADADGDCNVGIFDYNILLGEFGSGT